jgi:hypothetical protein
MTYNPPSNRHLASLFTSKVTSFFISLTIVDTIENSAESQSMPELELLAQSGFLSVVGMTSIPHGKAGVVFNLPQ